jgi:hypothetical protein
METTTLQSTDLAVRILAAIPAGQRTFALSSEELPVEMTIDGRVEVLRADQAGQPGSCNPPFSSWGN